MPIIDEPRKAYVSLECKLSENHARHQDIRALRVLVANVMPTAARVQTERRIAHLLGSTALQVNIDYYRPPPLRTEGEEYYRNANLSKAYDALIVTGANVDRLDFEDVTFMSDLSHLLQRPYPVRVGLCWGAMALCKTLYDLEPERHITKRFGIFTQQKTRRGEQSHLLQNTNDVLTVPVSRWASLHPGPLNVLAYSAITGPYLLTDDSESVICIANHPEYVTSALAPEAERDGALPVNYYPGDDRTKPPVNTWRADAYLLWSNLIQHIYARSVGVIEKKSVSPAQQSRFSQPSVYE